MRLFGFAVVLTFSVILAPLAAGAQQVRTSRLGVLVNTDSPRLEAFRQELRDQGYVEGRNMLAEYRYYAAAKSESLDVLARDLVQLKVDVIVTEGTQAALALRRATESIPVVVASAGDLVGVGLVASLARPGGNVTGLTLQSPETAGKRLATLNELVPSATSVAMLMNPGNRLLQLVSKQTQEAAQTLNLKLQFFDVERPDDFEAAFAAMVRGQFRALLIPLDPMFNTHARRLTDLATRSRLPAMFGERLYVEAGGLASYGPSYSAMFRRAAVFVDKILKGAKPADLPVEQPTKFELVINMKTAKALGLTIPQSILVRSDQLIE